jgi:hypothetical protein
VGTNAAKFVLRGTLEPRFAKTIDKVLDVLRELLHKSSPHWEPEDILEALKHRVVVAMVLWERDVPNTEHAMIVHELVHVVDCIRRWNSVRNSWAFFGERYLLGASGQTVHLHCRYVHV